MADSPIVEYQNALRAITVAEAEAEQVVNEIVHGANLLSGEGWRITSIGNDPIPKGFPAGIAATQRGSITGDRWPDAKTLSAALHNYHDAKVMARQAYQRIPSEERGVVQPPPE